MRRLPFGCLVVKLPPEIGATSQVMVLVDAAATDPAKPDQLLVIGADREPREMIVPGADRIAEHRLWIWLCDVGHAATSAWPAAFKQR